MFAAGNLMRFVSMRFAAQTVLSGLGSLQFVVIPVASRSLLGIKPQVSTGVGVATVLIGNLLIIMYGPPETSFTLRQLRQQWGTAPMRAFLAVLGAALVSLHLLWRFIHRRRRLAEAEQRATLAQRQRRRELERERSLDANDPDAVPLWEVPGSKEADILGPPGDPNTLRMFVAALLFSAVSSFIGAWSVLFSKSLTYVVSGFPGSVGDWYSWFTGAAFLGTAGYWVRQSNKGLKLYPATLIMPLMQAFWMAMSVWEGMIYFDEMATLSGTAFALLMLGLLLAIAGAVAMGLAGFFIERPHAVAAVTSPTGRLDSLEAQPFLPTSKDGWLSPQPSGYAAEDALIGVTGRADGLSSPTYRDKGFVASGSLSRALETELSRLAATKQARNARWHGGEHGATDGSLHGPGSNGGAMAHAPGST